jgi:hypothetical protein
MSKSVDIITSDTPQTSEPFSIVVGGQVQLHAYGLQASDRVLIEIVDATRSGPTTECCPGQVALPEVSSAKVLRCRNGARAILTTEYPTLTLDSPQDVQLRARVEADDLAIVRVSLLESDASDCSTCHCVEPYAASYPLDPRGFAFAPGDAIDPDATVLYTDEVTGDIVSLYPTPRIGATVAVRSEGDIVVGYARNKE